MNRVSPSLTRVRYEKFVGREEPTIQSVRCSINGRQRVHEIVKEIILFFYWNPVDEWIHSSGRSYERENFQLKSDIRSNRHQVRNECTNALTRRFLRK